MFVTASASAQTGGQKSFEFLNTTGSARLAALGGVNVSLSDVDLSFFMNNPAAVSDSVAGSALAGYQFYVADIGQATFAYSHKFGSLGTLNIGVQHIGYGDLMGYDDTGRETGIFHSGETALVIGKSHTVDNFRLGVNVKAVFSSIAGYRASALLMDMGGTFIHPDKTWTIGMSIRNIGFLLSDYSDTRHSSLPFDVQVGGTVKPQHMPLRFSLTVYNLSKLGKTYDNPDDTEDNPGAVDKVFRHLNLGTEILFHKNFQVLLGYNYQRRQELKLQNAGGGAGVNVGLAIRIKKVDIVISRSGYTTGNAGYSFSVAANIDKMITKREL